MTSPGSWSILYTGNTRSGINTWIDIGIMLVIRIYILMENFQILANDHFLFYLSWISSNYMCFFWYYIDIKTHVNRNFTTSTFLFFLFLDEAWDHAVWYYLIPATMKKKNTLSIILIHVITILNIVLINFYYACKHLIVLIIVECRLGLVQSRFQQSFVINGNNQATAEYND